MSEKEPDPIEGIVDMHNGAQLFWQTNEAGGRTYTSDEIPTGVEVWDTCLVDVGTLCEAISMEFALLAVERRAAERDAFRRAYDGPPKPPPLVRPADEGPCPNCGALGCWTPCPYEAPIATPLPEGMIVFDGDTLSDELRPEYRREDFPVTHRDIALRVALRRARAQLLRYSKTDPVASDIGKLLGDAK